MYGIGKEKLPSILKDPFSKINVRRIYVSFSYTFNQWQANGSVEFLNGDTKGEQKFEGETFDEVVLKIKTFLETLK
jgi:hypothetical protein